jgi:hypothetical protein
MISYVNRVVKLAEQRGAFAQQRGLAKAGRGGDEGQLVPHTQSQIHLLDQVRARYRLWPDGGNIEFSCQRGGISLSLATFRGQFDS